MNTITCNTTFTDEPTSIDNAVARQMHDRMHAGSVYILEGRAEMAFNPFTRHYQIQVWDERLEDMALAASSRDGFHIALLGLVNYDSEAWVERRPGQAGQEARPERTNQGPHAEHLRFNSEDAANAYYARARRLAWTVSHPFQDERGDWFVTHILRHS